MSEPEKMGEISELEMVKQAMAALVGRMSWFVIWLDHENTDLNFAMFPNEEGVRGKLQELDEMYDYIVIQGDPHTLKV